MGWQVPAESLCFKRASFAISSGEMIMKIWQIHSFGIEQLVLADVPRPRPGKGEVLVKVHAVSLNYRDLLMIGGYYNPRMALPRIPCSDGAGEVVEVGEDVTSIAVGQKVAGIFMQHWLDGAPTAERTRGALGGDVDGMLAEYVVLHHSGVVPFPEHLSHAEASTLPCAAVTAWNALTNGTQVDPGDVVVIQGTGGVSIFALQFAKLMGATVLGTSSSDEKLERAKGLGLDAGLNYRQTLEWAKWVLKETNHRGADVVVEVGGSGTFAQSLQAVRMGGTVAQIGVLSQSEQPLPIATILHRQVKIQGIYVGSRAHFEEMNRAISAHRMRPVVDKTFSLEDAKAAFHAMAGGAHFGKIVIQVVT
jgi:NADPH:quinone reductase-like Zn-dependent oxidoreductase